MGGKKRDSLELVLYLSIFGIFIGLAISIYFYHSAFGGKISTTSNDWSAFGSFFGGLFSPTVSFVTLVAILVTIKLQKRMLENQAAEFSKLYQMQTKTVEAQEEQLLHIKSSSEFEKIMTYKQTLLTILAQQMDLHQKIIDRCSSSAVYILETQMEKPKLNLGMELDETLNKKEKSEKKLSGLANLSITIAITKYQSTSQLDEHFSKGYLGL